MTEPDLEAILDECLHGMSARGETIERCLQRCPHHAGQLASLIQIADRIRKTSHPSLSVSATQAIEQRLLKRASELKQSRARPSLWSLPLSLRPLATIAAILIMVLTLVLAGGGIVYASTDSLPGDPLYGIKRATEQVQLFLAPAGTSRAELHIKFAQRRLEEIQALVEIKGQVDEEALAAMAEETGLALEEAGKASAQNKLVLLDRLVNLTERQQAMLKKVQAKAPQAAQQGLNRALEASQRGHERARSALEKVKPGQGIKPTQPPVPTETPRPTHTPKATPTPRPTHTPKATHTPRPTKTPKPAHAPGGQGQGQKPLSTPPGQSGVHGPPATPPGQSEEHGPPATPPGQSEEKEHGPFDTPPGQDKGGGKEKK